MTAARARRRLFVALEVAGPVASEIDGLRRAIGSSSLGRIAPHLTLIPPVNVGEPDLTGRARRVARRRRSRIRSRSSSVPPGRSRRGRRSSTSPSATPRVVARLQRRLDQAPLAAPPARPSRPFSAHVTLSSRIDRVEMRAAVELFAHFKIQTVLSALTLYEQHHDKARHPWVPLADVVLGASTLVRTAAVESSVSSFACSRSRRAPWKGMRPARVDGGTPAFVIGREGAEVVGVARGATVGAQLVIDSWCVVKARRCEGVGRALVRAVERARWGSAPSGCSSTASSDAEAAFLDHIGLAAENGFPSSGARWFAPRLPPMGGASGGRDHPSEPGEGERTRSAD